MGRGWSRSTCATCLTRCCVVSEDVTPALLHSVLRLKRPVACVLRDVHQEVQLLPSAQTGLSQVPVTLPHTWWQAHDGTLTGYGDAGGEMYEVKGRVDLERDRVAYTEHVRTICSSLLNPARHVNLNQCSVESRHR